MSSFQKDEAAFDFDLLQRLFGRPRCLFSGEYNTQWHHIKGRGNKKDADDRRMHSSPLNAAPLIEKIHMYAPLHDMEIEEFFLRKAFERVTYAIARGAYELTDIDRAFMQRYRQP